LDYSGGATCPSLLLEPQRSNLVTFSESFDNAAWTKTGTTISANVANSPAGFTDADKLFNSLGTNGFAYQTISLVSSTIYSGSVFAKNAGADSLLILFSGSGGNASCTFNLTTLTTTPSGGVTAKIEDYGGGWYRCSVVFTATSTAAAAFRIYPSLTTGDGTSGIFVYGAQLEAGAYATSYLNTLSTSVTRVADAAYRTSASAIIGQAEGTLFAEFYGYENTGEEGNRIIAIGDGTSTKRIIILDSNTNIRFLIFNSGIQADYTSSVSAEGNHKVAIAYANNDVAMYIDGVQVSTDTSATIPACSNFYVGTREDGATTPLAGGINQALVFKTRLSNADLATLTTL